MIECVGAPAAEEDDDNLFSRPEEGDVKDHGLISVFQKKEKKKKDITQTGQGKTSKGW